MEVKHTKGGWSRNVKPASKYPIIFAGRNTHVAQIITNGISDEEAEANADLIAAAPKLLAAAIAMIEHWNSLLRKYAPSTENHINDLRSAVSTAMGYPSHNDVPANPQESGSGNFKAQLFQLLNSAEKIAVAGYEIDLVDDIGETDQNGDRVFRCQCSDDFEWHFADQEVTVTADGECSATTASGYWDEGESDEVHLSFRMSRPIQAGDIGS